MPLEIVDDPAGQGGDPSRRQDPPKSDKLEIVVNGKREEFDLTNPEHRQEVVRRTQMGTNYSQRAAELNARESEFLQRYKPIVDFDAAMKVNPDLETIVVRTLRGDPVSPPVPPRRPANGNGEEDDEDARALVADAEARLAKRDDVKEQGVVRLLSRLNDRLDQNEQRERDREDAAKLKRDPNLKPWITDDHIELARERRRKAGGSLEDNFKILFFNDIPKFVERQFHNALPPEARRALLTQDSGPLVIDGEAMTEERLTELRRNPDEYAKVRDKIRAARRRRLNLAPVPGRK